METVIAGMDILKTSHKLIQAPYLLKVNRTEYIVIRKGIAECTGGIRITDRRDMLGVSDTIAYGLYDYLDCFRSFTQRTEESIILRLTERELHALRNALRFMLNELGETKYFFRTGLDFIQSHQILVKFDQVLKDV